MRLEDLSICRPTKRAAIPNMVLRRRSLEREAYRPHRLPNLEHQKKADIPLKNRREDTLRRPQQFLQTLPA